MKIGGLIVLSEYGQRKIAKFPSQSKIHNPENTMHQLLDAMGEYNDYLEDLLFKHEEKKDLRTNYSDEDESEEDYILGFHMLNLLGECYKIFRYPNESNNDFRARILSIIDNDGGISSLKNIISKILRIDKNLVEVIENEMSYFTVGDVLDSRIESVNSKPLISRITNIEQQLVVNIPQGYDTSILEDSLKNCVLADVKILINPNQTPTPSTPIISVTNITSDSVIVSFSSTNTNSYDIYLNDVLIANTTNTSYNLTDLSASTTYTVKIVAKCNGTAENTKTFTTSDNQILDNKYLEFIGRTQYINTNHIPSINTEIEISFEYTGTANSYWKIMFGTGNLSVWGVQSQPQRYGGQYFTPSGSDNIVDNISLNSKHKINFKKENNNANIYFNDILVSSRNDITTPSTYPVFIGNRNINGTPVSSQYWEGRIYRFKVWQNSELVMDLYPIEANETITIDSETFTATSNGFINLINGDLFYNKGSGNLNIGYK